MCASHTSSNSSALADAMGAQMDMPSRWYAYHTTTILPQVQYEGQTIFYNKQPSISFLDHYSVPTPLYIMQSKEFKRPDWEHSWTGAEHRDIGQKITLRIRLQACTIDKQINVRRFTNKTEAYTKSKLGHEIAKALSEPLKVNSLSLREDFLVS